MRKKEAKWMFPYVPITHNSIKYIHHKVIKLAYRIKHIFLINNRIVIHSPP